jgi:hypothetical protein
VKKYLVVSVLAVVLTVGGWAGASLAATMADCRAACGSVISSSCGGLRPHKFALCQKHTLRQCKKFGVAAMCPAPTQPTPTTTTLPPPPPPTTTTTVPYIPPTTTTTLPPPPQVLNVQGEWDIAASLVYDPCGLIVEDPLVATGYVSQSGTSLVGAYQAVVGPITLYGGLTGPDSFSLESAALCFGPCCADIVVDIGNIIVTGPGTETGDVCVGWLGVCSDGTTCPVHWGACS